MTIHSSCRTPTCSHPCASSRYSVGHYYPFQLSIAIGATSVNTEEYNWDNPYQLSSFIFIGLITVKDMQY